MIRRFPGFLLVEPDKEIRPDPVFAHRSLPDAHVVNADSVAKLVRGAFEHIAPRIDTSTSWIASSFSHEALRSRNDLVRDQLLATIKEKLRRSYKRMAPGGDLLQIALVERTTLVVSFATPTPLISGFLDPVLPVEIPEDKRAPSSAYRKVEEAYALLGCAPGPDERVVDLGAAPGGWSWTALKRGATVTSVDRADLLPPVAGAVTHLKKDAFTWEPEAPFDWLLCDAIAVPEKSIALLDRWLEKKWCRRFVLNVKFKGTGDYGKLDDLRKVLAREGLRSRVKQLQADKNEVTALGLW